VVDHHAEVLLHLIHGEHDLVNDVAILGQLQTNQQVEDVPLVLVHVAVVAQQLLFKAGEDLQLGYILPMSDHLGVSAVPFDESEQVLNLVFQHVLVLGQSFLLLLRLLGGLEALVFLTRELIAVEHTVEVDVIGALDLPESFVSLHGDLVRLLAFVEVDHGVFVEPFELLLPLELVLYTLDFLILLLVHFFESYLQTVVESPEVRDNQVHVFVLLLDALNLYILFCKFVLQVEYLGFLVVGF